MYILCSYYMLQPWKQNQTLTVEEMGKNTQDLFPQIICALQINCNVLSGSCLEIALTTNVHDKDEIKDQKPWSQSQEEWIYY